MVAARTERTIDGLYTLTLGRGVPILALHGGLGFDHTLFRPWLDPLAEHSQLVYHDFRGNGRSVPPADPEHWRPESLASDVEKLRQGLGLDRVVLLGHSVGSHIALTYARAYPEHVAGLIICSGAPVMDFMQDVNAEVVRRATPAQLASVTRLFTAVDLSDEGFRTDFLTILPLYFVNVPSAVVEVATDHLRPCAAAWMWFRDNVLFNYTSLPWLSEISAPVLILVGGDDFLAPVGPCGDRWKQHLAAAELHVLEGTGHLPFAEAPERFATLVCGWLARLGRPFG